MSSSAPQSYANHTRFMPLFHFVAMPLVFLQVCVSGYHLATAASWTSALAFLAAVGVLLLAMSARLMALTAQDRVIRLEERLRMQDLLPADLQPRIGTFTPKQLVALRFASDAELPTLARKVLDERIVDQKAIKQLVTDWRADHLRV